MAIRIKRIIAFIIDWNLTLLPAIFLFELFIGIRIENKNLSPISGLFCFICVFGGFALFITRDYIFKGESLAKKLFKLTVIDKNTSAPPTKRQLILKNIFLFIYPVEGILLLATGETLGNRISDTIVVPKKQMDENSTQNIDI
jgi:uncharacterized RDD family membrane protein YckC